MKQNNVVSIIALIVLILVGLLIFFDVRKKNGPPIERVFPDTIDVATNIELPYVNLITKTIIHEVLKIDTLTIMVLTMTQDFEVKDDITTLAFVLEVPSEDHSYIISISPSVRSRTQLIRVLSHEFAHIKQFESGQLKVVDRMKGLYVWEGDTLDLRTVKYGNRPMETEAFKEGRRIEFEVIPLLYGE